MYNKVLVYALLACTLTSAFILFFTFFSTHAPDPKKEVLVFTWTKKARLNIIGSTVMGGVLSSLLIFVALFAFLPNLMNPVPGAQQVFLILMMLFFLGISTFILIELTRQWLAYKKLKSLNKKSLLTLDIPNDRIFVGTEEISINEIRSVVYHRLKKGNRDFRTSSLEFISLTTSGNQTYVISGFLVDISWLLSKVCFKEVTEVASRFIQIPKP